ncbi:MAG: hypothetical protein HYS39_03225, partial [Proteobacteria bacterium]|nr:hypothetical protein [Pseudomonadota bacterium]
MSLRKRLLLLVITLLIVSVTAVVGILSWTARENTASQAEEDGLLLARLIARSAGVLDKIPEDIEDLIGQQMVTQALFVAHMIALAEAPPQTPDQIIPHLKEISQKTTLSEILVTNDKAESYIHFPPSPFPFIFEPYSKTNPKQSEFYDLLLGKKDQLIQPSYRRDDQKLFKYVGVKGIDKSRIIQVGYELSFLERLKKRIGFQRLVENVLSGGYVNAIWIVNSQLETVAFGTNPDVTTSPTPSEFELDHLEKVVSEGKTVSTFHEDLLKVMSPIRGHDNTIIGATILQLPTDQLKRTVNDQLMWSIIIGFIAVSVGGVLTYGLSESIARPIHQ